MLGFVFQWLDLGDASTLGRFFGSYSPKLVIHLAAQAGMRYSLTNPHVYAQSNLIGFLNILEACRRSNMEHVILRPLNLIGAEMKNRSFFALVKTVARGRYFFIDPRGAIATYVHVEDVVHALVACQKAPKGGVYNLSSDCTWEVLIERIAAVLGIRSPRLRIPALPLRLVIGALEDHMRLPLTSGRLASLTSRSRYSSDRIVQELGFAFAKPMPEGIEDVVKASL